MSLSEGLSKGIVAGFSTKTSEGTLAEAPKGFSKKLSLRDFAKDSRGSPTRILERTLEEIF